MSVLSTQIQAVRTLACGLLERSLRELPTPEPDEETDWLSLLDGCEACLDVPLDAMLSRRG